jgi:hypothetical protein
MRFPPFSESSLIVPRPVQEIDASMLLLDAVAARHRPTEAGERCGREGVCSSQIVKWGDEHSEFASCHCDTLRGGRTSVRE